VVFFVPFHRRRPHRRPVPVWLLSKEVHIHFGFSPIICDSEPLVPLLVTCKTALPLCQCLQHFGDAELLVVPKGLK